MVAYHHAVSSVNTEPKDIYVGVYTDSPTKDR